MHWKARRCQNVINIWTCTVWKYLNVPLHLIISSFRAQKFKCITLHPAILRIKSIVYFNYYIHKSCIPLFRTVILFRFTNPNDTRTGIYRVCGVQGEMIYLQAREFMNSGIAAAAVRASIVATGALALPALG